MTETSLTLNAACCLLHMSNFPLKLYKKSLTKHLLNAAKALILILWKTTRTPTIAVAGQGFEHICDGRNFGLVLWQSRKVSQNVVPVVYLLFFKRI